jgi:hypothetical protein
VCGCQLCVWVRLEWMRLMCKDGSVEWMRLLCMMLCMTVYMYNYEYMCDFSV